MSWPIEIGTPCSCSVQMSVWSCGIALFYILFSKFPLFPLYFSVYVSMSASLYHYHLTLHLFGRLWVSFSLCCFLLNFIWLILPSQASTFPLLVPYFLDSFFKYIFFFNWERDWETCLYSVTTAISQTFSFYFLIFIFVLVFLFFKF